MTVPRGSLQHVVIASAPRGLPHDRRPSVGGLDLHAASLEDAERLEVELVASG